jgi:hypothetical protein
MARKKASKSRNPANVDITITDGNPPTVSPDPAYVSKNSEVAHWKTKPLGQDFLVVFEGNSPFDDWCFDRDWPTSKITTANPGPPVYKYTVYTARGAHRLDPGIIIRP